MSEAGQSDETEEIVCQWCGKKVHKLASFHDIACQKCYRALVSAGVPEKEILRPRKSFQGD